MKIFRYLFEITPGATLTPARGLRTTMAFVLALLVLSTFGHTSFGGAVSLGFLLGALFTSFCDLGVSVRVKMVAVTVLTLVGPFVVAAGRSLAAPWWVAVPSIFLVTLSAGLLSAYGPLVSLIGSLLAIVFVATLGIGGGPATALPSALGFLLGGALVLLLILVFSLPGRFRHHPACPAVPASPPAPSFSLSLAPLLAQLDLRSPLFRQALLRALGVAVAAALAWGIGVPYPQWAPIVVLVCVRPEKEASVLAALQNVAGTVLGALLADLLIYAVQDTLVVALILVVVVFIAFTVKDLNYTLFTFFITNLLLLFISIVPPGVSHIRLRIFAALVGAGIALALTFLNDWLAHRRDTPTRVTQ